jgi:1-deoxy-D-xylulose-5-phosphate synthase
MKGRDILGGKENVIAVIGDGSLSGGEAFEGLDTVAEIGTNMIIVVNDNEMSIANNPTGGLYKNLAQLRETKGEAEHNYFKSLGFEYMYVEEGNDVVKLVEAFLKVKDIDHPVVVHIHTEKGHGFKPAVENKEMWHFGMPFNLEDGSSKMTGEMPETYDDILNNWLWENMQKDPKMVIVTAGTPACMGFFADKREKAGKQFIDCGIAEEQAVAIASGIAKRGGRPVFTDYATFFQRTYDQLAQDLAVNGNSAVMNVTWASISAMNDFTHIGFFDIPMISHIPNLHYMAPTTAEELVAMEKWAVEQDKYSIAIRVPFGVAVHSDKKYDTDYSDLINKAEMLKAGEQVAIIGVGNYLQKAESVSKLLEAKGINATVINPRWVSGSDEEMLEDLKKNHRLVVTLEDGCLDGGYGERISRFYSASDMKVLNFGVKKQLYDRYDVNELMKENHLTDEQIVEDILSVK